MEAPQAAARIADPDDLSPLLTGNAVAVAVFITAHAVLWPIVLVMTMGAITGGYAGAHMALKLQPKTVGYMVIAIGFSMSAYFFWRMYFHG